MSHNSFIGEPRAIDARQGGYSEQELLDMNSKFCEAMLRAGYKSSAPQIPDPRTVLTPCRFERAENYIFTVSPLADF